MEITTSAPTRDRMTEDSAVTELMESDPYYSAEGGSAFHGDSRELLEELGISA